MLHHTEEQMLKPQLFYFIIKPRKKCRSHNLTGGGGQKVTRRYLISENVDNSGRPLDPYTSVTECAHR